MSTEEVVACKQCGSILKNHTRTHQLGPFSVDCRRDRCHECEYLEAYRCSRLVKKLYQDPFPRPQKDGKMPLVMRNELAKILEKEKEKH